MSRIASAGLLVLLASTGVARAGRHENWKAVERLAQDKPVLVQVRGQAGVDACLMVSANDSTLTCARERDPNVDWDAGSGARLVFPRAAVRNVWLMEEDDGLEPLWVDMAAGFGVGALVCSGLGPALFVCAGIGALLAPAIALSPPPVYPRMPRPPRAPAWKRRLIYRAPPLSPVTP